MQALLGVSEERGARLTQRTAKPAANIPQSQEQKPLFQIPATDTKPPNRENTIQSMRIVSRNSKKSPE
jgi:hypothetical protein